MKGISKSGGVLRLKTQAPAGGQLTNENRDPSDFFVAEFGPCEWSVKGEEDFMTTRNLSHTSRRRTVRRGSGEEERDTSNPAAKIKGGQGLLKLQLRGKVEKIFLPGEEMPS